MRDKPRRLMHRALAAFLLAALAVPASVAANPNVGPDDPSPIAGAPLYVDAFEQPSARAYHAALAGGRLGDAAQLRKIAGHNIFRWIGKTDENPERAARNFLVEKVQAEQPGAVPGITVLNHVGERCDAGYDGGGSRENGRYRRWIDSFAAGIGPFRVIIAFEPDSLGTLGCMSGRGRRARLANMKYAVGKLAQLPNATVYVEATASDWRPAREVAGYLRRVGISRVRGFMLNATHQDSTRKNVRYGQRLSRMVGGKHFVINTAENGSGNLFVRQRRPKRHFLVHCNPKNSSLGHWPTTTVDHLGRPLPNKVDGYLWINRPGASAGRCGQFSSRYAMKGGPAAGRFWLKRALLLAGRSKFE
jgi:endoglucanase